MSVTFFSNAPCELTIELVPCLCAQCAPQFLHASPDVLRHHATPDCAWCKGAGVYEQRERAEPMLNLANPNARALLTLLGLPEDDHLLGQLGLPEMRRALIRARSTFERRAPKLERLPRVVRSARAADDGTSELVDRVRSGGLSREMLADYVTRLERLCAFATEHGATWIRWE